VPARSGTSATAGAPSSAWLSSRSQVGGPPGRRDGRGVPAAAFSFSVAESSPLAAVLARGSSVLRRQPAVSAAVQDSAVEELRKLCEEVDRRSGMLEAEVKTLERQLKTSETRRRKALEKDDFQLHAQPRSFRQDGGSSGNSTPATPADALRRARSASALHASNNTLPSADGAVVSDDVNASGEEAPSTPQQAGSAGLRPRARQGRFARAAPACARSEHPRQSVRQAAALRRAPRANLHGGRNEGLRHHSHPGDS